MTTELFLNFSGNDKVTVSFNGTDSGALDFTNPVTKKDRSDIQWYIETYGSASLAEPDDQEAKRIEARLPEIGKALFEVVFPGGAPQRLFDRFQGRNAQQRVLTINAQDASILSLPWELLYDPTDDFLFQDKPHISIRRKIPGTTGGREPYQVDSKDRIHLLFVVSRPSDAGFIDPRTDPQAVMNGLEKYAPGRVSYEFLRPATLDSLAERLDDDSKPVIDILHFDGHGVFRQVSEKEAEENPGLYGKSILSEIQRERQLRKDDNSDTPVGIGFLLFEKEDGTKDLVSANEIKKKLKKEKIGLVVLSACQTAALDDNSDPMASVAGRLTATGIPAILAMTHSVLVATTEALFGRFYQSLAQGRTIARSLDDARDWLATNPEKYEVRRGSKRQMLKLHDWFLPSLYQGGLDSPLLTTQADDSTSAAPKNKTNLRPPHEVGFFGRRRELWDIECWFATNTTRRISITGFGGQGKTELALEAGRWLTRTNMFERAVFLDYLRVQSEDAASVAVSTIATVLEENLPDVASTTRALAATPTLIILDNLETVSEDSLRELLDAAHDWSNAGGSRVLLTSHRPDFNHPEYRIEGTCVHRRISLQGLGSASYPDDALAWFVELDNLPSVDDSNRVLPPKRDELIELFDRVSFHPLSIAVLAQQLRTRTAKRLGERLQQLLSEEAESMVAEQGTPASLIASLHLSLERLNDMELQAVQRLGVFQGGAFEDSLLKITGLGQSDGDGNTGTENLWLGLRHHLEAAALIKVETVAGVTPPFLHFHPTLAPMLWKWLDNYEQNRLTIAHCQCYFSLAKYLYNKESTNPHRARVLAWRELPNLLHAVGHALDTGDTNAVTFVNAVNLFVGRVFCMTREADLLTRRAEKAGEEKGSEACFLAQANRGDQLLASGQNREAMDIFSSILYTLGDEPSYKLAVTLACLGECYNNDNRTDLAENYLLQGIEVTKKLTLNDSVRRNRGRLYTELANVFAKQGKFTEARTLYVNSLKDANKSKDSRGQVVNLGQLGTLALRERKYTEAELYLYKTLPLFQLLKEPAMEAVIHNHLGLAASSTKQWQKAEQHYRQSAHLSEKMGNLTVAAQVWGNLGLLNAQTGKPEAAETWYRKAIEVGRQMRNHLSTVHDLCNLANLLQSFSTRLVEAGQLAEEALAIGKTLDPSVVKIWEIYTSLAEIADKQAKPDQATLYRSLAREAKRNYAGIFDEIKVFASLISTVVGAVAGNKKAITNLVPVINQFKQAGGEIAELAELVERILSGERVAENLCKGAGPTASMIIETILQAIKDRATLESLLPNDDAPQ